MKKSKPWLGPASAACLKWPLCLGILLAQLVAARAQSRIVNTRHQIWSGFFNQTRLSNRWGLSFDYQLRTRDHFTNRFHQMVARPGISYYVADWFQVTAAYAYFLHFPSSPHQQITQPEHRLWQQLLLQQQLKNWQITQRLRVEQRFRHHILNDTELATGYEFTIRYRYQVQLQAPMGRKAGRLKFYINDELMVQSGNSIQGNWFDQNRFSLGFNWRVAPTESIQLGYLNLFQQQPTVNHFNVSHCIRVNYLQSLDLRKPKKIIRRSLT